MHSERERGPSLLRHRTLHIIISQYNSLEARATNSSLSLLSCVLSDTESTCDLVVLGIKPAAGTMLVVHRTSFVCTMQSSRVLKTQAIGSIIAGPLVTFCFWE